tara:strand:- start:251 stop:691 length:441 start_codon:yes stop_codon:yes gene_type:complete
MSLVKQIFLAIFLLSFLFISPSISKDKFQEYGGEDDVENPFEGDPQAIAEGYERFNSRCSYCHGMRGIGAKGPPLTRGYFKKSGGLNINLYSVIASGLQVNGQPTQMGAFSRTLSDEEIWKIIAYMRQEYKDRKAAGSEFKYGIYP